MLRATASQLSTKLFQLIVAGYHLVGEGIERQDFTKRYSRLKEEAGLAVLGSTMPKNAAQGRAGKRGA
jgi:hypothetical protein